MRIAVSGSHGVGKSTLIGAFLAERPDYAEEPEAFEVLADSITLLPSEGPDLEGLEALLDHTLSVVQGYASGAKVVFERSPVDYLAYAMASKQIDATEREGFIRRRLPAVRQALGHLDLIVLLPVEGSPNVVRPSEDDDFCFRVDVALQDLLVIDEEDLFDDPAAARVMELPLSQAGQLRVLLGLTSRPLSGAALPRF